LLKRLHIGFWFACILISLSAAHAQDYEAKFTVNSGIGCDQFTVVATDLSGVPDDITVIYLWGDGTVWEADTAHTYQEPGIYTIIQSVANAVPRYDTAVVEVIEHYPPEFNLFSCKGRSATIQVIDTLYEAYEVDWGDSDKEIIVANEMNSHTYAVFNNYDVTVKGLINGNQTATDSSNINCSSTTKTLNMIDEMEAASISQIEVLDTDIFTGRIAVDYELKPDNNYLIEIRSQSSSFFTIIDTINRTTNPNKYIVGNLNTTDNYYCISITAFDPCDGEMLQSNIGCSVNLQTSAANRENRVEWQNASADFQQYSISRDGRLLNTTTDRTARSFIDDQVVCGTKYAYQVSLQEHNGMLSISDTSFVTSISTDIPEAIKNITASVAGDSILLSWEAPSTFVPEAYFIKRSTNGGLFEVLDTLTGNSYVDNGLFTQSSIYTYIIQYFDACGNISSESIPASHILLVLEPGNILLWTPYVGWLEGVSQYVLEKYDGNGQLIESIPLGQSNMYLENQQLNPYQSITYRVYATPNDISVGVAQSNLLEVIYPSLVTFPNAFSPNGDGINDVFKFEGRYIQAGIMKIYNRWGELVYQSNDPDLGWNGTVNGKAAPQGSYIYHAQLTDDMGITFTKTGEIILIR
jgi:gliding motility-associated-like protein